MIRRLLTTLLLLAATCTGMMANQEMNVYLDNTNDKSCTLQLGFAYITFDYLYTSGNTARVNVTVENITQYPPMAVMVFTRDLDEGSLKYNVPKVTFDKKYPGEKGSRRVYGCGESFNYCKVLTPAEKENLFTIDVPLSSPRTLSIPFYEAKYKPKALLKKGKYEIPYTIMEEHIFDFKIEVKGWSESDPEYVAVRKRADEFIESLAGAKFCDNPRHKPSLAEQQRPYLEEQQAIETEIAEILRRNTWMSTDPPYVAYDGLLKQVKDVDLGSYTRDCGRHAAQQGHRCSLCSLSAQQIYHRLDDLYQQLYVGRIGKTAAAKQAKALYSCYQSSNRRKKDSSYTPKIQSFYNRIVNY